ncbi:NifB/NifX family molybdenum-iron cluster-binding protein [Calditrichota bacterium GD2]
MKVAIVTNDGQFVSQHFGRSKYYKVYTIEDNQIINVEMRERGIGHHSESIKHSAHSEHHEPKRHHGYGPEAKAKHVMMAREIADCDVLIAGGMGMGAYEAFKAAGLQVILTDIVSTEEVITAFNEGKLEDLFDERTH